MRHLIIFLSLLLLLFLFKYSSFSKENILLTIIIILIVLYYFSRYIETFYQDSEVCNRLYIDQKNDKYTIIRKLITPSMCKSIIQEAEDYAKMYGWTTTRHDHYPTTDNEINKEWNTYNYINNAIHNRVFKEIERLYNVRKSELGINEIFVAKYHNAKNHQSKLEAHVDGSEFSFVLALNDEFDGGGTQFMKTKETIKLNTGDCLVFSGQNKHRGIQVKRGTRYILTGFLNYKSFKYCSDVLEGNEE